MRVLVIEDELRLAKNIARGLREASGYAVNVGHDGEETLVFCRIGKYDLMLPKRFGE